MNVGRKVNMSVFQLLEKTKISVENDVDLFCKKAHFSRQLDSELSKFFKLCSNVSNIGHSTLYIAFSRYNAPNLRGFVDMNS